MIVFMMDPLKNRILSLDAPTPRYTSYPPATAFDAGFPVKNYQAWLKDIKGDQPVSLYVHIPFCKKLCYYCGCFTTITSRQDRIETYIDDLIRELDIVTAAFPGKPLLSHLHFGGGSPTILRPILFNRLMHAIQSRFTFLPEVEIAIEADPRQMTEARIATFALNGINRISLGMQDTDQVVLSAVNRQQPFHLSWDAVKLCREYGIDHINLDLMYGLPGQRPETIAKTMENALSLKPDRIAFFGYAHVPWMKKHMRLMDGFEIPDASLRYDLYETGSNILVEAGYLSVGIDHFVRPSDSMAQALGNRNLQRNFQGYTTDVAPILIGIGASSIGKFPQGYIQNIADLLTYHESIKEGNLPVNKGYALQPQDHVQSAIISELMCYMAVDLSHIISRYDLSPDYFAYALKRLAPLQKSNLVSIEQSFIRANHPHVARLVASCFDPMITDTPLQNRHSRAV